MWAKLRGIQWWHPSVIWSAWRHIIGAIPPLCHSRFYKHSLNDTQLAAWRQLSVLKLRPHLSLPPSFPPLSHSGVQLGKALFTSSLPPSPVQTLWSRSCKNSLPGAGLDFLFFLWDFLRCLGETSWCTDSWGDNFLFLLSSGFFSIIPSASPEVFFSLSTVFPFTLLSCSLILIWDKTNLIPEMGRLPKRATSQENEPYRYHAALMLSEPKHKPHVHPCSSGI